MIVGILNVQGNMYDIKMAVEKMNGTVKIVKQKDDLEQIDCLIIPAGNKNTLHHLYNKNKMIIHLAAFTKPMFIFGANILLFSLAAPFPLLHVKINRVLNDYYADKVDIYGVGNNIPVLFICSPQIEEVGSEVQVMAKYNGKIVMLKEKNIFACTFQPLFNDDLRIISFFLSEAANTKMYNEVAIRK